VTFGLLRSRPSGRPFRGPGRAPSPSQRVRWEHQTGPPSRGLVGRPCVRQNPSRAGAPPNQHQPAGAPGSIVPSHRPSPAGLPSCATRITGWPQATGPRGPCGRPRAFAWPSCRPPRRPPQPPLRKAWAVAGEPPDAAGPPSPRMLRRTVSGAGPPDSRRGPDTSLTTAKAAGPVRHHPRRTSSSAAPRLPLADDDTPVAPSTWWCVGCRGGASSDSRPAVRFERRRSVEHGSGMDHGSPARTTTPGLGTPNRLGKAAQFRSRPLLPPATANGVGRPPWTRTLLPGVTAGGGGAVPGRALPDDLPVGGRTSGGPAGAKRNGPEGSGVPGGGADQPEGTGFFPTSTYRDLTSARQLGGEEKKDGEREKVSYHRKSGIGIGM